MLDFLKHFYHAPQVRPILQPLVEWAYFLGFADGAVFGAVACLVVLLAARLIFVRRS